MALCFDYIAVRFALPERHCLTLGVIGLSLALSTPLENHCHDGEPEVLEQRHG